MHELFQYLNEKGISPFLIIVESRYLHFQYFQIPLLHLLVLSVSLELGHPLAFCSIQGELSQVWDGFGART